MKRFTGRRRKKMAWGLSIAMMIGLVLAPVPQQKAKARIVLPEDTPAATEVVEWETTVTPEVSWYPEPIVSGNPLHSISPEATASARPTATAKPTPTVSPSKSPAPTAKPVLTPNPAASPLLGKADEEEISLTVGDRGAFDIDRSNTKLFYENYVSRLTRLDFKSSNSLLLQVESNGTYQAMGIGKVSVTVIGYGEEDDGDEYSHYYEEELFQETFTVYIYPDMTNVTLSKNSVTVYCNSGSGSVDIKINSSSVLDEDEGTRVSLVSSNEDMYVRCEVYNNVLTLECSDEGSTKLTVTINGREFTIDLKVVYVKLSNTSLLLVKKQTKQLKVQGISEAAKWSTSNQKVVAVNAKGRLRAKREGNAIITVRIGDGKLGCVVSVTNSRKKKVIARAQKIASTSKYSQAKRMQKGYYDCSSLVWRSYSAFGYKIGAAGYAPTAASQAQWFAGRKRLLKGGYSRKNVQGLKINAGDLLFETGQSNGRYKGIYHVEMFIGYAFYGFDAEGKAIVGSKWANRPDNCYGYGCGIVGRV